MKVRELIAQLSEYDGGLDVVIEFSDEGYAYVDDVDDAMMDLRPHRPRWDFGGATPNAVRICG